MPEQADKNRATAGPPGKAATEVDARGLRCPLPALRLARAVREGGPGRYLLLAEDPAAQADIPALCAERGWTLLSATEGRFEIRA
jgi:tRNA 2-thiouridine synthesizing protein A